MDGACQLFREDFGMRIALMLWMVAGAAVALAAADGDTGIGSRADADALQQKLVQHRHQRARRHPGREEDRRDRA